MYLQMNVITNQAVKCDEVTALLNLWIKIYVALRNSLEI